MKTTVQQQLSLLADKFRKLSAGLFEFSTETPAFITRDKGIYAYLYGKPSKRLARTLAVDREVLVLISAFEDQQQRTIKTAREVISDSDGRLESTVVVILHRDPDGNSKLPNWGRGLGLAVLPVFAGNLPGSGTELERHLSYELFSHDPFDVTGPVSDDVNFFGRRNEAQDLARKLQQGQIRSCLGIRKIGKTSIINRVVQEVRLHHDCNVVMLDCSRDEIWQLSPEGLLTALAETIATLASQGDGYIVVNAPVSTMDVAKASVSLSIEIEKQDKPTLIFIDEVDYITPGSPTALHWSEGFNVFWRNFRAVYQEALRKQHVVSMMVGGVSSKWFSVGSIGDIENAALAFIPEEYLSPLSRNATVAMIQKLSRSSGLTFTRDAANIVSSSCSDMPFWVRKACSYIHRHVEVQSRPVTPDTKLVQSLVTEFIEREGITLAQVAVQHLFRVYPELEPYCMSSLEDNSKAFDSPLITVLRRYGVLAESGPVRPSGEMVKNALVAYRTGKGRSDENEASGLEVGAAGVKDKKALTDWADDLAVINKERNLLEKRMRNFVLNFIRANNIASKQRGSTKDKLIAAVPGERKPKLNHLSPDELIEQLYWSELVRIIQKEWPIFAGVFGDRKQFEMACAVVNDRADAHAKDVDQYDIALYRKYVKWLADRLASI